MGEKKRLTYGICKIVAKEIPSNAVAENGSPMRFTISIPKRRSMYW